MHIHWTSDEVVSYGFYPHEQSYGDIINIKYDMVFSPEDTVLVKICRWVEPEGVALFSSFTGAVSDGCIAMNIGLNRPLYAFDVSQDLKVTSSWFLLYLS